MKGKLNRLTAMLLAASLLFGSIEPAYAVMNLEEVVIDDDVSHDHLSESQNNQKGTDDEAQTDQPSENEQDSGQNPSKAENSSDRDQNSGKNPAASDDSETDEFEIDEFETDELNADETENDEKKEEEETDGLTRREWIENLVSVFDLSVEEDELPDPYFPDVQPDSADWTSVMTAVEFGLLDVEPGSPVSLDEPATREYAAWSLNQKLNLTADDSDTLPVLADAAELSDTETAQIAVSRGWFSLDEKGCFNPDQAVLPEEVSAINEDVRSILEVSEKKPTSAGNFVFADFVIVFDQATEYQWIDDETLIIYNGDQLLKSGDVFVIWSMGLPVIREADAVSGTLEEQTVICAETDESAAIISADASGSSSIDLETFEAAEGTTSTYVSSLAEAQRLSADLGIEVHKGEVVAYSKFTLENGLKVDFTATISNLDLDWSYFGKDGSIAVSGKYTVLTTTSFKASDLSGSKYIPIGYVSLLGIGKVSLSLEADLNATANLTYSGNFRTGIKKTGNSMGLISEFRKNSMSADLSGDASLGIAVNFDIDAVLAKANAYLRAGLMSQFNSRIYNDGKTPNQCTNLYGWLYVTCGASGKILGKSASKNVEIYNHKNSPVHLSFHWEDGVRVFDKCSRGTVFYLTGATSKLGSSSYGGGVGSGTTGTGENQTVFTYTLNDEQKATITGYQGKSRIMRIPDTVDGYEVAAIGNAAFQQNTNIVAALLPDAVIDIPAGAFKDCSSLQSVVTGENIVSIGSEAFRGCLKLRRFDFPESVTQIAPLAFADCQSLTGIKLPANLASLGGWAFRNCDSLSEINIPAKISEFPTAKDGIWGTCYGRMFEDCDALKTVRFDQGITELPEILNYNSSIEELVIPETVTTINFEALRNCSALVKVKLPSSLKAIKEGAFIGCRSLKDIQLPEGLTTLGSMAFYQCESLESINIPKGITDIPGYFNRSLTNTTWHYGECFSECTSLKNIAFSKGITTIRKILNGSPIESIEIPATVTTIDEGAFEACSQLKEIKMPNSVTQIGHRAFSYCESLSQISFSKRLQRMGSQVFRNCYELTSVTIPKTLSQVDDYFDWGKNQWVSGEEFSGCRNLKEIIFEEGTKTVFPLATNAESLEKISLPQTVTEIRSDAFRNCISLKIIDLPENLTKIPDYMMYGCKSLTQISLPEKITDIGEAAFYGCSQLADVKLNGQVNRIGTAAFGQDEKLTRIEIPDSVTVIGDRAFGAAGLQEIRLPGKLKSIGSEAFKNTSALQEITIPESVETLNSNAFENSAIQTAILNCRVTSLGNTIFKGCVNLKNVSLSNSIFTISKSMFESCESLQSISIPVGCRSIQADAFKNAYSLEKVVIPEGVAEIHATAFSYPDITVIHGKSGSTAEIWAQDNGFEFVAESISPQEILLDHKVLSMQKGVKAFITYKTSPDHCTEKPVFTSEDETIAQVSETGQVKAVQYGDTNIIIQIGTCKVKQPVHVYNRITEAVFDRTEYVLKKGEAVQMKLDRVVPAEGSLLDFNFVSDHPEIAQADSDGKIQGLSQGSTKIKVYTGYNSSPFAELTVTVTEDSYEDSVTEVTDWKKLETEHPYSYTKVQTWKYTSPYKQMFITFDSKSELEPNDRLEICNGKSEVLQTLSGKEIKGKTIRVPDRTVILKLHPSADHSSSAWGFKISELSLFTDVPSYHWGVSAITESVDLGLITGYDTEHFAPFDNLSRGMAVTVLWRMAGSPEVTGVNNFKDVGKGMWFEQAVVWASSKGIVNGYSPTQFGPFDNVTREQLAIMVTKYLASEGVDTKANPDLSRFKDLSRVHDYAMDSIKYAVSAGILSGADNGTMLYPHSPVTRVEAAKMLTVAYHKKP